MTLYRFTITSPRPHHDYIKSTLDRLKKHLHIIEVLETTKVIQEDTFSITLQDPDPEFVKDLATALITVTDQGAKVSEMVEISQPWQQGHLDLTEALEVCQDIYNLLKHPGEPGKHLHTLHHDLLEEHPTLSESGVEACLNYMIFAGVVKNTSPLTKQMYKLVTTAP